MNFSGDEALKATLQNAQKARGGAGIISTFVSKPDAPEQSFAQWREPDSPGVTSLLEIETDPALFQTTRVVTRFKRLSVTTGALNGMTFTRNADRARHDGVDGFWIELLVGGGGAIESCDVQRRQVVGQVCVGDYARPFRRRTEDSLYLAIYIARDLASGSNLESFHHRPPPRSRQRLLAAYLRRLAERAPFIADEERLERTTRAVLTAATLGDPKAIDEGAEALDDFIFEAATRFIDQNLQHEHLGVQGIAADLGVSRPTLYRVFRPINGVDAYIWNRRLRRAWELLIDPICDRSVLQISETLGFKDASHFTRRFKAEFGVRPSDIR